MSKVIIKKININLSLPECVNDWFNPEDLDVQTSQTAVPAHQPIQAIFAQLRQLPPHIPTESSSAIQVTGEQPRESSIQITCPASFGEFEFDKAVLEAVLEAVQVFLNSDRTYEDLLKLGEKIKCLGYRAYSKQSATSNDVCVMSDKSGHAASK